MNFSKISSERKPQSFSESLEPKSQRGPTPLTGVELYSVVTLLVTLSAFGTAGNVLVLCVFRKKKDKLVSTVLIIVLACVDLSTCVVIMPYTVFMESVGFLIGNDVVCKAYQFLITSNIPFSALIMVTIAVDRYLCICHPFLRSGGTRKAKRAVVGLGLFAAGIGLCVSLMYGVYYNPVEFQPQPYASLPSRTATSEPRDQSYVVVDALLGAPNRSDETPLSVGKLRATGIVWLKPMTSTNYSEQPPVDPEQRGAAYDGICAPNDLLLSRDFQWYFQKVYNGLFLVCFVTVAALYVLIYRSVLLRRRRRMREKRKSQSIVASLAKQKNRDSVVMQEMITIACEQKDGLSVPMVRDLLRDNQSTVGNGNRTGRRKSWSLDSTWMVNMKTAVMLFVVTVVFIVTFLPAFLMTLGFLPYHAFVFYLYFANNVANPLIYSFMNQNFRDDLRRIFCRRHPGTTAF